eukprot:scaffold2779_cov376-Prasinococcus_capsulatus_cf.AAC.6
MARRYAIALVSSGWLRTSTTPTETSCCHAAGQTLTSFSVAVMRPRWCRDSSCDVGAPTLPTLFARCSLCLLVLLHTFTVLRWVRFPESTFLCRVAALVGAKAEVATRAVLARYNLMQPTPVIAALCGRFDPSATPVVLRSSLTLLAVLEPTHPRAQLSLTVWSVARPPPQLIWAACAWPPPQSP